MVVFQKLAQKIFQKFVKIIVKNIRKKVVKEYSNQKNHPKKQHGIPLSLVWTFTLYLNPALHTTVYMNLTNYVNQNLSKDLCFSKFTCTLKLENCIT